MSIIPQSLTVSELCEVLGAAKAELAAVADNIDAACRKMREMEEGLSIAIQGNAKAVVRMIEQGKRIEELEQKGRE